MSSTGNSNGMDDNPDFPDIPDPNNGGQPPGVPVPKPPPPPSNDIHATPNDNNMDDWLKLSDRDFFNKVIAGSEASSANLLTMERMLNKKGIQILRNANGIAGKIRLADGTTVDVIQAANDPNGNHQWQWLIGGNDTNNNNNTNNTALDDYLAQLMKDNAERKSNADAQRKGLQDRIHGLEDKYAAPVTADDSIIAPQVDAYRGETDRTLASYREKMAERAHAEGLGSGAFDAAIGESTLAGGRAVGGFQAGLMGKELTDRRGAYSDVLRQDASLLGEQDTNDLQQKIAAIDAELRNKGLNNQNTQWYDKFVYDQGLDGAGLDAALARLLAGGSR